MLKNIARLYRPDGTFYGHVLTDEEIAQYGLASEMMIFLDLGWWLSRNDVDIKDLFDWFMPGVTFDSARPQYWNDAHVGTPEYNQTVWVYEPGSSMGRPCNFMKELWPQLVTAAKSAHHSFHAERKEKVDAS